MRDRSLQFQFPDADLNTRPLGWLTHLFDFLGHHGKEIGWTGWALLAVVVALVLWLVGRWLWRRGLGRSGQAAAAAQPMAPWQPSARQARLLLRDADALAAQGRFDAAVHLLLLVCIQEIADRFVVTPALTSREIARLPHLSALAQQIFSGIAQVVEVSRFGGRPIGDAEFGVCRAAFEKFTQADTWRMAA